MNRLYLNYQMGDREMFTIQQTKNEVMVWARMFDGRKVCVLVGKDRFEAQLWIETAQIKLNRC